MKSIIGLLQKTRIYRWILMSVLPYLGFRIWGNPKYEMAKYFEIRKRMWAEPKGIWVFVGVNKLACSYLLNKMLTGAKWSHAGFLDLDDEGEVRCLHMMAPGYCDWSLLDYLREVDDFYCFQIPCSDPDLARKRLEGIAKAKPAYDFDFELEEMPDRLYCSELVWWVMRGIALVPGFEPHQEFGRKMFEPDDVVSLST